MKALIMAGGRGTRLGNFTDQVPKPMLPIGGRPLLAITVERLRQAGISDITVSLHYRPEFIKQHFGDAVKYLEEPEPMGSGGCLQLMAKPAEPLLVINGDVLTDLRFEPMREFHEDQAADCTMAVGAYHVQLPYAIVMTEGPTIQELAEKPNFTFPVNAGIYILDPSVWVWLPKEKRPFGMGELVQQLINLRERVCAYPMPPETIWVDIGTPESYAVGEAIWPKS